MPQHELTYAIADLHGRFDLLLKALSYASKDADGRPYKFVVLGDFVDRGPESRQIIDHLRFLQSERNDNMVELVVLKGNHEDMMFQCLTRRAQINWWIGNGGGKTLISYGAANEMTLEEIEALVPKADLDWLNELPVYHLDDHRAFVHAGFNPDIPLAAQRHEYMMWRYDGPEIDDQPNYEFEGRHVVHGHVQHMEGPVLLEHTSNLDTFAWASGRLAMAVFDSTKPGGPISVLHVFGEDVGFEDILDD